LEHLSGIASQIPPKVEHKAMIVLAEDHGIVTEGAPPIRQR
jgi:NaMN:DMB phosphoribosyltransferase